jgi:thiaminase
MFIALINLLIIGAATGAYFFFSNLMIFLVAGVLLVGFNFFYLSRYGATYAKLKAAHEYEFTSVFTYFKTFLSHGSNVYQALVAITPLASPFVNEKLQNLIDQINEDKSVAPFIEFAKAFESGTIEQIMLSVYQLVETGGDVSHLERFSQILTSFKKTNDEEIVSKKAHNLENLSVFPLGGAGAITVILALGVITIIGGIISGL